MTPAQNPTIRLGRHTIDTYRKEVDGKTIRHHKDGTRSAEVVALVDISKMSQYAKRALTNRKGTCRVANGAIVFKVLPTTIEQTNS